MVHAVCFNKNYLQGERYERVVKEIGARDGGNLIKSLDLINCIESFASGDIYKSLVVKRNIDKDIIDCGDDIEKFIYINKYGRKEENYDMEYEDLVQLVQDGEITMLEFVERQEDIADMWEEWLTQNDQEKSDQSASDFLKYLDDYMMEHQGVLPPDYIFENNENEK